MAKLISGTVTVTTAGTAVSASTERRRVVWLEFKAKDANSGNIFIGDSNVSATDGYELHPPTNSSPDGYSEIIINIPDGYSIDLADVYIDSAQNGDKADFIAIME